MDKRFEVNFFGTDADGDEEIEVMRRVQRLLKIDQQQLIHLFEQREGVVLARTSNRDKAERLTRALKHAGARAVFLDHEAPKEKAWEKWSLQDKQQNDYHVFHCRACNHAERLSTMEALPAICPECGVVAAKYQRIADKKKERERIRRKVLDMETAKLSKHIRAEDIAREQALRKEIEREVRRELGLGGGWAGRLKTTALAVTLLGIGAAGAVGLNNYLATAKVDDTVQAENLSRPDPLAIDGIDTARTLFLANNLLARMTGEDWTQHAQIEDQAQMAVAPESWWTGPATGAGNNKQSEKRIRPAAVPQTTSFGSSAEVSTVVRFWERQANENSTNGAQLRAMIDSLMRAGRAGTAVDLAGLTATYAQRYATLRQIVEHPSLVLRPDQKPKILQRLQADTVDDTLPGAAILNQLAVETLRDSPTEVEDQTLSQQIRTAALPPIDEIAVLSMIGAHRAHLHDPVSANIRFGQANRLLDQLGESVEKLNALQHLAEAYQIAGESAGAKRLASRLRAGMLALPTDTSDPVEPRRRLIQLLVRLGEYDTALATIVESGLPALSADLLRAELSEMLAGAGQRLAAKGMLTEIHNPAAKARATARLSRFAAMQGRADAQNLAAQARAAATELEQSLKQIILSDLGEIDWLLATTGLDTKDRKGDTQSDRVKAVVATNLAWNRATETALELTEAIADTQLRSELQQQLRLLDQAFAGIARNEPKTALR